MIFRPELDGESDVPIYRQLHDYILERIQSGAITSGERLPATRELAGLLGLNRTTVSAAYELLESGGWIAGHVGRGSFVTGRTAPGAGLDWEALLGPGSENAPAAPAAAISFASSRPAEQLFPLDDIRASCGEVMAGAQFPSILQLGSPAGYEPLRQYLLEEARRARLLRAGDDLLITSGCQQALDLIARVLLAPGDKVALEDPVYPGLKNLLAAAGAQLIAVPVGGEGLDVEHLERALARERPKLLVVTSNFQNPTGATVPAAYRRTILRAARQAGTAILENDIYGALRYSGEPAPPLKELDEAGGVVLLRSFSKITFPGLRVGWVVGPRPLLARLAQAKQLADLHTDQLSQALLLRFAESGRLEAHRERVIAAGAERLEAVLAACERWLPAGSRCTRPQGGMNVWVTLPEPLDAGELLPRIEREGVAYLPGRYFEVARREPGSLRLSFAGLAPAEIRKGLAVMGSVFRAELENARAARRLSPAPAMV